MSDEANWSEAEPTGVDDSFADVFGAGGLDAKKAARRELLPAGNYRALISSFSKKTNDEGVDRFVLTLQIVEPESMAGRKLPVGLNLKHPKPDVREYAKRDLANISLSAGIAILGSWAELMGKEVRFTLKHVLDKRNPGQFQEQVAKWFEPGDQVDIADHGDNAFAGI